MSWDAVEALFPQGVLDGAFDAFVSLVEELADGEEVWDSGCPVTTPAALGARLGDRVVVSMRKGWEQVAAVLGVLRAGCV
ncbi:hypothetical protein, partial [Streptomyces sp. NRRL S-37]|uniref:hypothetical protein n=1 Tax=Streptomyces sp. NRRL S-37 TaxID=1463903 RepID=UPI00131D0236